MIVGFLLPLSVVGTVEYFRAIADRALYVISARSRDKLALAYPDLSPGLLTEQFFNDKSNVPFITQYQPRPFTCLAISDSCVPSGQCLYRGLRWVYGNFIEIKNEPISLVPSLSALLGLAIAGAYPFHVGFKADSAGWKSFVQHRNSHLSTLREFFDSLVFTEKLVESIDFKTLSVGFAKELETLGSTREGNISVNLHESGIQRWLDETSEYLCQIYEFYRTPRNELKATLILGEVERNKFEEIGKILTSKAIVRVAVLLHVLAITWTSERVETSMNLIVLVGVAIVGSACFYYLKKGNFHDKYI